jgi:hypothetical protein
VERVPRVLKLCVWKLTAGLANDVARLAASYPQCPSMGDVRHAVDLETIVRTDPSLMSAFDCHTGLAGAGTAMPPLKSSWFLCQLDVGVSLAQLCAPWCELFV